MIFVVLFHLVAPPPCPFNRPQPKPPAPAGHAGHPDHAGNAGNVGQTASGSPANQSPKFCAPPNRLDPCAPNPNARGAEAQAEIAARRGRGRARPHGRWGRQRPKRFARQKTKKAWAQPPPMSANRAPSLFDMRTNSISPRRRNRTRPWCRRLARHPIPQGRRSAAASWPHPRLRAEPRSWGGMSRRNPRG